MSEADFVVVGGGSAGCVLARRLSDDPAAHVCLIEAGPPDDNVLCRVPLGAALFAPTRWRNWAFETEPQAGLNGRRGYQPRGRMLGGSSAINAMIYMRGHPSDYDDWAAAGCRGWGWQDVLPYFKRAEANERLRDALHGTDGPLNVADLRSPNPFAARFLEACEQAGLARNPDFNGAEQEGVGWYQVTQKDGERCSAAAAYLTPEVRRRSNLEILTNNRATKVRLEGLRASGVELENRSFVRAKRSVILCAGAFQSPQLLMLSGVGPAEELERHGIGVVRDLPGVGRNLQDHLDFILLYKVDSTELVGFSAAGALRLVREIGRWRRERRGMLTSNFAEAGGFLRLDPAARRPDIQLHFVVALVDDHARKPHWGHGYSLHVCVLRPRSRGSVSLASADPLAAPRIDPNFLGCEEDTATLLRGVKLGRSIMGSSVFSSFNPREIYTAEAKSGDDLLLHIRQRADTIYHPAGTCRMGTGTDAVVDPTLKVHGMDNLYVADASVMPTLVGGNTNAPCIMIGERAAEFVRRNG
ncbi:MAG: GMC family oxidoreductase N-terminal domain-containing protein [Pseudomonadota bacterium]